MMMSYLLLGFFVLVMVMSGYLAMRKTKNVGDFFLGGRDIGPWMSAFAYGTTYFSAVLFVGYAGKLGWGFGLGTLWIGLGNAVVGSYLAWRFLATPTRKMTEKLGVMTMPEFLQARFDSHGMKIFAALVIFLFLVPYSASVYMGLSYVFEVVFALPYNYILLGMAGLTAVFLLMGGYRAIAITDFFLGTVMLFGVFALLYFVFSNPLVGGLGQIIPKLKSVNPGLVNPFPTGMGGLTLLSLVILTSLGPWGLPQMIQKFYAVKDAATVKRATIIATVFSVIIGVGAYSVGSVSRLYFTALPVDPTTGKATVDLIIPTMIKMALPELAAVLILLLILSASMSTLSSVVLVSSSTVTIDFLKGYIAKDMSKKTELLVMRLLCFVFIALSFGIAFYKPAIILTLMAISWGTISGVFLGPYIWGVFWSKTTIIGAWSGAVVGLATSLIFAITSNFDAALVPIGGALAMVLSILVVPLVSLVTQNTIPQRVVDKIYSATEGKSA